MNSEGYKAIQTYTSPMLWKTDATPDQLFEVFKSYKHQDCEDVNKNLSETSTGYKIFSKKYKEDIDFNYKSQRSSHKPIQKYFENPTSFWGPKSKAK